PCHGLFAGRDAELPGPARLGAWRPGDFQHRGNDRRLCPTADRGFGGGVRRFDFTKLESLNGHYIRSSNNASLIAAIEDLLPHIAGGHELASKMTPVLRAKLLAAMPGLKERAKTLVELFD